MRFPLTRWLQLAIAAMFFAQAFVYTVIDPYLPQAFPSISGLDLSIMYGAYPVAELAATALLVVLQALPQISALQPSICYTLSAAAFAAFTAAGVLAVVWASSVQAMLCQRLLMGLTGGVYNVYVFKGVAGAFKPEEALRAVASINAGLVAGDAVAPILGALVFSTVGAQLANAAQPAVCAVALLLLVSVPLSLQRHKCLPSSSRSIHPTDTEPPSSTTGSDTADSSISSHYINIQPPAGKEDKSADATTIVHMIALDCQHVDCQDDCITDDESVNTTAGHARLLWKFLSHKPLAAQLCMLVLTQSISGFITILLPQAWEHQPTWFVMAAFAIQALCAMVAPFIVETAVRWRPNLNTPLLLAITSLMLAAASGGILPAAAAAATPTTVSKALAVVFVCGAITGAASAAIEVLIFHHEAIITAGMGYQLAVDFGAIVYTLFYTLGNFVGGVIGGAAAHAPDNTPSYIMAGISGVVLLYGVTLSASMYWSAPRSAARQQSDATDVQLKHVMP